MAEGIDLDCGRLLSGEATLHKLGDEMFDVILRIAVRERVQTRRTGGARVSSPEFRALF
jgi:altronate dehydratase